MTIKTDFVNWFGLMTFSGNVAYIFASIIVLGLIDDPFNNPYTKKPAAIILVSMFYYMFHVAGYIYISIKSDTLQMNAHKYDQNYVLYYIILSVVHLAIIIAAAASANIKDYKGSEFYQYTYIYNIIHFVLFDLWIIYLADQTWNGRRTTVPEVSSQQTPAAVP